MLDRPRYLAAIAEGRDLLAASSAKAGLDARVPSCPRWSVRDLLVHVGNVHAWAELVLRTGVEQPQDFALAPSALDPESVTELCDWYVERADSLIDCLSRPDIPDDRPSWTFGPPGTAVFWARRQAHEVIMHSVDARLAAGASTVDVLATLDAELASDGVDEVLTVMLPRVAMFKPRPELSGQLMITAVEDQRNWMLLTDGQINATTPRSVASATLIGRSPALFCLLWKRARLDVDGDALGLRVEGDPQVVDQLLAARLTP